MTNDTNAAHNAIPIEEHDPKNLFDDYSSTASNPKGFYEFGIEAQDGDVINQSYAPSGAMVPVVEDETNLPQSEFNPKMPARGSRLCDLPLNSPQRGGRSM